jgi:phage shock protein PspC (stress-responsive transcriptional regulator)
MQKTLTVNISGASFFIDEDAHAKLNAYIQRLENWFKPKDGGDEIIADIESRLAEIFAQKIKPETGVITLTMVDEAIAVMGQPEEFEQTTTSKTSSNTSNTTDYSIPRASRKLYRDVDNRVLGGVCSGLASYLNLDPVLVRVVVALIAMGSAGSGLVIYVILWAVLPPALTTSQKLEMRGENVTIQNIEKTIRDEFDEVKKGFSKMKDSDSYKNSKNFLDRMNPRDRVIAIVVLVIIGLIVFSRVVGFFTWMPFHMIPPIMPFIGAFGWIIPLTLVLVGVAIITKKDIKPMLLIVFFIFLAVLVAKIIEMMHHSSFSFQF